MQSTTQPPVSKKMIWTGRIVGAIPALFMIVGGAFGLAGGDEMVKSFQQMGYPAGVFKPLIVVEIVSAVLYLIPQTSVLGAILITGYLGGATDVHVRQGEWIFFLPVVFGVLVWLGLYLREPRIRALFPLKRP